MAPTASEYLGLEVLQPTLSTPWAHVRVLPLWQPGGNALLPPCPTTHPKLHLVFVVDVSGSMGSTVQSQDADGNKENHGFSILDLVKHSLLTIVNSLNEAQTVTLITFSDDISVEFRECAMSREGVETATQAINNLRPQQSTNLWIGLKKAYDILKECSLKEKFCFHEIMLFTDGMPNVEPPRGHIPTIQHYLQSQEIPAHNHSVRTYGFGYSLDSKLLQDIAILGRGTFSFIPDAGFVGTIFIHALADMLVSVSNRVRGAKLQLAHNKRGVNQIVGLNSHKHLGLSKTCVMHGDEKVEVLEIPLGTMEMNQSRDFIVRNPDFSQIFRVVFEEFDEIDSVSPEDCEHRGADVCELLPVTDDNLEIVSGVFQDIETLSMVSDFISFNLRNQKNGAEEATLADKTTPDKPAFAWVRKIMDARDNLIVGSLRGPKSPEIQKTPAEIQHSARPHFCRLQMCDIISSILDGDDTKATAKQAVRGSYVANSRRGLDTSGLTLEEKQARIRDFIEESEKSSCSEAPSLFSEEPGAEPGAGTSSLASRSTSDRLTDNLFEGCMEDLKGQVTEAVSKEEFYRKWGVFFLRSLAFAHQTQKRNNFKDFGVQWYGEEEFEKQVDRINDIFDKLPPPKPSNKFNYGVQSYAPTSMSQYNNCYGGCFLPECLVEMADGTHKRSDAVRRGDTIRTGVGNASAAKVLCVIKIVGSNMMCVHFRDSQLGITPWHPMLVKGEWVFPAEYAQTLPADATSKVPTQVVYNFVLESAADCVGVRALESSDRKRSYTELLSSTDALKDHTMVVNGVPAVTFGHGLDTNSVVKHEYWANMRKILRDLHVMPGFYDGEVILQSETACVKDPTTNLVVKLVHTSSNASHDVRELTDGDRSIEPAPSSAAVLKSCSEAAFNFDSLAFGCCESIRG